LSVAVPITSLHIYTRAQRADEAAMLLHFVTL